MSLPIDAEAIAAQTKAEHEYGERLMDLAQVRADALRRDSVTADDIEWVSLQSLLTLDRELVRMRAVVRCICAEKFKAKEGR